MIYINARRHEIKRPLLMLWTVPPSVRGRDECGRAIEALTQNAMVAIGTKRTWLVWRAKSVTGGEAEVGGGAVAATGSILLFPFYETGIGSMQLAQIVHSVVGMLYIASMLVHTYMGTIGMEGAFEGMANGDVDVNWAKSHHSLWYEEEMGGKGADRS